MPKIQLNLNPDKFEELWQTLTPDSLRAKVLIEVDVETPLETALNVLKNMGIHKFEHYRPLKECPDWILLQIAVEDVREIILAFSEAGFTRVKGVNPGKVTSI